MERTKNDESYYKDGQVIHITGKGDADNKKWKLIPQSDGTYHIQNVRSEKFMSLEDLSKIKENDTKLIQATAPLKWEIEIVSGTNTNLPTTKQYDSLNFTYKGQKVTSLNWMGALPKTLKIIVISRINPDSLQGDNFNITVDDKVVQWGLDCHEWKDSKDKATALTVQGSNYEVWTQDNWNHDAGAKKPYIKASLLGNTSDGYTNSTLARYEQAKLVNKDAWVFNYTSCSASPATPFKNTKEIHQWLYDRSEYTNPERLVCCDTFTGVMAFDYVDELLAKLVYQTNFHRHYITVHGYNSVGTELVDPITIYVGENEVVRTKLAKDSTTQQIVKAHFNVGSSIVTTTESGDFISAQIASDVDGLTDGASAFNADVEDNTTPDKLYVLLVVPNHDPHVANGSSEW